LTKKGKAHLSRGGKKTDKEKKKGENICKG